MKNKSINVLSLFDGMSCGQIALKEAGFKVNKYYASEIDKHAIRQTQENFPNTIQLGDVTQVKAKDLEKIDLLIGGSPCQGFSFAGKQLNFDDPRSALFFEFVRLWEEVKTANPNAKFLLENVNMKREYLRVISEYLGVFPVRINSNLVSAQNRDRWYWTNIRTKETGLFSELWSDIPQPKDSGILLRDVLQPESEVDQKYFLSGKMLKYLKVREERYSKPNIRNDKGKASCIMPSSEGKQGGDMNVICVAMRGRNPENSSDRTKGAPTQQRLEPKTDGKTNCLTSVSKDNLIMTKNYVQWDISGKGYKSQQDRAFYEDGKHGALPAARAENKNGVLTNDLKLRRLTPIECARLQTIPDWYRWIVSDTQIYKMLGNGWTVDVIKHIFSYWKD